MFYPVSPPRSSVLVGATANQLLHESSVGRDNILIWCAGLVNIGVRRVVLRITPAGRRISRTRRYDIPCSTKKNRTPSRYCTRKLCCRRKKKPFVLYPVRRRCGNKLITKSLKFPAGTLVKKCTSVNG